MAPFPEPPVPVRRRFNVLEIDGEWRASWDGSPLLTELAWLVDDRGSLLLLGLVWLGRWTISRVAPWLKKKPIVRFSPGEVTVASGARTVKLEVVGIGVDHLGSGTASLFAWQPGGRRTPLPGPTLLPLEAADLAELLDAHVRGPQSGFGDRLHRDE